MEEISSFVLRSTNTAIIVLRRCIPTTARGREELKSHPPLLPQSHPPLLPSHTHTSSLWSVSILGCHQTVPAPGTGSDCRGPSAYSVLEFQLLPTCALFQYNMYIHILTCIMCMTRYVHVHVHLVMSPTAHVCTCTIYIVCAYSERVLWW